MQIFGIIKPKPTYLKILAIVLSIVCVCMIFILKQYTYIVFPILVILAVILEKKHIVDEKGVIIHYSFLGKETSNIWPWEEIEILMQNFKKAEPNVMCFFKKNMATRAFILSVSDAKILRDFVSENHKNIEIQIV